MAQLATIVNEGLYIKIPEWGIDIYKGGIKDITTKPKSVIIKMIDDAVFSLDSREFIGFPDGATLATTILEYANNFAFGIPSGGLEDQILVKASDSDFDLEWATDPGSAANVPDGGLTDQVLTKASDADQDLEWATPDDYIPPSHVITVAKSGGDFDNITDALAAITDNSSTIRYTISVASGEYTIDNSAGPLQLKSFCNISAIGLRSVVFKPQDPTKSMFIGENFSYLVGIVFSGNTGASAYILEHSLAGNAIMDQCVLRDCSNGILNSGASSIIEVTSLAINNPATSTTVNAINIQDGKATIDDVTVRVGAQITNLIVIDGSATQASLHNILSISPIVTTAIKVTDGATVVGTSINLGYCYDGLVMSGDNTEVRLDSVKIMYCQNEGFRVENVGTNPSLALFATTVSLCTGLNFNILNATASISGNGFTELNNSYSVYGARFYAYLLDITDGDEGLNVLGELHVGTPETPTESVFGGGDSYTRGILVYTEDSVGTFVDVTTEAVTASGSTFTFPGVTTGNSVYVASTLISNTEVVPHYGIKTSLVSAAVMDGGDIITEYYNGVDWVEVNAMESESTGKYEPHANNLFQHAGSHQIRYDSEMANDSWTTSDLPNYGTPLYWTRFRISSTITTSPVIEQIKVHTSRFEINGDGWVEYFGKARPIAKLPWEVQVFEKATGTDVKDQDLYLSKTIDNGGKKNRFVSNQGDPNKAQRIGFKTTLPFDMDTSSPVDFQWSIVSDDTDGGTIDWIIRWGFNSDGDSVYTTSGSAPTTAPNQKEINYSATPPATSNKSKWYKVSLDVSDMMSRREGGFGDTIWVSMQRASSDTHDGDVSLISMAAYYTKWCEGGHI